MQKKDKQGLAVLLVIVCVAAVISVYESSKSSSVSLNSRSASETSISSKTLKDILFNKTQSQKKQKPSNEYIAKLQITGTIQSKNETYNQEWLLDTIDELQNDENNKGIILFIDSPGGTVYEADEVYLRLLKYKEEKPVYAYMGSLAASGGYYIACAADYIMANRNTLTGSIGVIAGEFTDITGLMEKYGVHSETIHAGRNKNMGNINEPITDEQRKIMQSIADECYEQFTGIVSESRNIPLNTIQELADGRIYTAKQALDNHLIDGIAQWEGIVSQMTAAEFENTEYEVVDYHYEQTQSLYRYLLGTAEHLSRTIANSRQEIPQTVQEMLKPKFSGPAYYYGR